MTELEYDAGPMALIEENGNKTWVVYAKSRGVSYKLKIRLGENQMDMVERSEQFATVEPCA
jgi:hypothetical protein